MIESKFVIALTSSISFEDKSKYVNGIPLNASNELSCVNLFADKSTYVTFLNISNPLRSSISPLERFKRVTLSISDCEIDIVLCASLYVAIIFSSVKALLTATNKFPFNVISTSLSLSSYALTFVNGKKQFNIIIKTNAIEINIFFLIINSSLNNFISYIILLAKFFSIPLFFRSFESDFCEFVAE